MPAGDRCGRLEDKPDDSRLLLSSPWCEADWQRRNNHIALGILLGLHKGVSTREAGLHWKQAQPKFREIKDKCGV